MKTQQSGFTLIELIAVIVLLAIVAVIALSRFADLSGQAKQAAVDAVAGDISSAMAMNYAAALAEFSGVPGATYDPVDDCDDGDTLLVGGVVPTGYIITSAPAAALGIITSCTLTANGKAATFRAIGAP